MVEVRMGDENGIDRIVIDHLVARLRGQALLLGVHPRIQDDPDPAGLQYIRISPYPDVPADAFKNHYLRADSTIRPTLSTRAALSHLPVENPVQMPRYIINRKSVREPGQPRCFSLQRQRP